MSESARIFGLIVAAAMLVFSGWMYLRTDDWVALIFFFGSLCYIGLFFTLGEGSKD